MLLNQTNWLVALRDDILERQTLYPDGEEVGVLTKTNWLVKLRNDILARQTLYPSSENIGLLHKANWLGKLRHAILTSKMLYPEFGVAGLGLVITRAQDLLGVTLVSIDGTDVSSTEFWVIQSVYDTFEGAINDADLVLSSVTDDEDPLIQPAILALNSAIDTFNTARARGTM